MDNVVLGLSIAIAIVLVLLWTCWDKGSNKKKRPTRGANMRRNPPRRPVSRDSSSDSRYRDLKDLNGYDDYNQVVQYMSVDPEVYASHELYATDMNRSASGPSMLAERDDPNDVVPWVGLRRPKYREVYASETARQEHSERPDQMRENNTYCIG
jgi:hypothetical protein